MAATSVLKVLAGFFNAKGQGSSIGGTIEIAGQKVDLPAGVPASRALRDFSQEIKALSDGERLALAQGVCTITGDTLAPAK